MKVRLSLLLLVLWIAPAGFAQTGVAGKWTGQLSAVDGHGVAQPITIELKLDGTSLTGTVTEGALEARPIQAATVDGNNVTFRTSRNLGGPEINVNWKGELKGDDLALSREMGRLLQKLAVDEVAEVDAAVAAQLLQQVDAVVVDVVAQLRPPVPRLPLRLPRFLLSRRLTPALRLPVDAVRLLQREPPVVVAPEVDVAVPLRLVVVRPAVERVVEQLRQVPRSS